MNAETLLDQGAASALSLTQSSNALTPPLAKEVSGVGSGIDADWNKTLAPLNATALLPEDVSLNSSKAASATGAPSALMAASRQDNSQLLGTATTLSLVGSSAQDALTQDTQVSEAKLRSELTLGTFAAATSLAPIRLEAEALQLQNYSRESNRHGSGGQFIRLQSGRATGTATGIFEGATGTYNIKLGYVDENDGNGEIQTRVGDRTVATTQLNQQLGSDWISPNNRVEAIVASNVQLTQGDRIQLLGKAAGDEYARIDYVELIPVALTLAAEAVSPVTPTLAPAPFNRDPIRVEAEAMNRSVYRLESSSLASGNRVASLIGGSRTETGRLTDTFKGDSGRYNVVLGYFDENDGQAEVQTRIGDRTVATTRFDQGRSSNNMSAGSYVKRVIAADVSIQKGDRIELIGKENGDEHARIDYIEFVPITGSAPVTPPTAPPPTAPPVNPPITPPTTPPVTAPSDTTVPTATLSANRITSGGSNSHTFTVRYADNSGINASTLDNSDVRVTGPRGFSQLASLVSVNSSSNGTPRTATYRVNAPGGTWDNADNGTYTVAMQGNQVRDTSGNAVTAGSLGSFNVQVPAVVVTPPTPPTPSPGGSISPPANARLVFSSSFNNPSAPEWGREIGAAHQFRVEDGAGRFELRKNDPMVAQGKRAELKYTGQDLLQEHWVSFRMYLPPDYVADSTQDIITQWQGAVNGRWTSPALTIRTDDGKWRIEGAHFPNGSSVSRELFWSGDHTQDAGKWIDWTFHVNFADDSNGQLQVWKDGEQIVNDRGVNGDRHRDSLFFKIGMYKQGWATGASSSINTRVIKFDDVKVWTV